MANTKRIRLLIIYTGGTIGMIEDGVTHTLRPYDFDHIIGNVPKIKMLDYDIEHIQFETPIDSASMNPQHWVEIASTIHSNYDSFDGFVVLHGTDTMSYTASALSFMLKNLDKPVIITGSQLPIGGVRTDGEGNLIAALQIAATRDASGLPMVREVAILFENYLWRGNRSTKCSATNFNAFHSNNYPELARIGLGIHFNKEVLWRPSVKQEFKVEYTMDTNVMYLDLFPGIMENTVRHALKTPGIKGIVLKTFGAGNALTDKWFTDAIREATESGIIIINVTQCPNGTVNPMLYESGRNLFEVGVVSGHDITCEAAITKLMYLLGLGLNPEEIKKHLDYSLCGEISTDSMHPTASENANTL